MRPEDIAVIEARWNCRMVRLGPQYMLDWIMLREREGKAFATSRETATSDGMIVPLAHWRTARKWRELAALPYLLLLRLSDGLFFTSIDDFREDVLAPANDTEPALLVPLARFRRIAA